MSWTGNKKRNKRLILTVVKRQGLFNQLNMKAVSIIAHISMFPFLQRETFLFENTVWSTFRAQRFHPLPIGIISNSTDQGFL